MAEALEKSLVAEFECPICTNFIFPPIYQCMTGHTYCNYCFSKLKKCPQCNAPKTESRCFTLECIHAKITFPCRFHSDGCTFSAKGAVIKNHEVNCMFSPKSCPLRFNNKCKWSGRKQELIPHCAEAHPRNMYFTSVQKLVASGFGREYVKRSYFILFSVFQEIFRCSWDLCPESGSMRFAVYKIGKHPLENTFSYEISFLVGNSEEEAVVIKAPVFSLEEEDRQYYGKKFMTINYDMVVSLCTEEGDLNYIIRITKNDTKTGCDSETKNETK